MDEREGERRALVQSVRHGIRLSRENADANRKMARAYGARAAGIDFLPGEVLQDYASALRDEATSNIELADAMLAEIARRG